MNKTKVIWFDVNLAKWEYDWLSELLQETNVELAVTNTFEDLAPVENCVVVANHAVNYRAYLEELRQGGKKYGVVLLSDENLREPMEYIHDPGCLFVARNYFHPFYYGNPKVTVFGLGYKKGFNSENSEAKSFDEREYDWCFAGSIHNDERKCALEALEKYSSNNKVHICSGFDASDGLSTSEYRKMLGNSKYALCPAGQDSMDSFRIYEALEAGAIPVTLAHTPRMKIEPSYWHAVFYGGQKPPFIIGSTWEEAVDLVTKAAGLSLQKDCEIFWGYWKNEWRQKFKNLVNKLQ